MKTRQGKPAAENTFIIFQRASCSCGSDPFCAHQSIKQASKQNHRPPASQAHGKRVVIASSDKRVNQSEVGNFNNTGRFQPACLWSLVCLQPQGSALPPTIALEQGQTIFALRAGLYRARYSRRLIEPLCPLEYRSRTMANS